jgi:hypothetical protein
MITLPDGMTLTYDGYLRIKRRGPLRDKRAHRVYVERQIGRPLRADEHVHHDCRNRTCWPPTDFHLVLMDAALHAGSSGGHHRPQKKRL